jgi:hypothetical protein
MSTWTPAASDQFLTDPGTYRFTLSYPFDFLVPDISPGKSYNIPFTDTNLTLTDYTNDPVNKKLYITIVAAQTAKSNQVVNNLSIDQFLNSNTGGANPYAPLLRTPGGYVKVPITDLVPNAAVMEEAAINSSAVPQTQFAFIPVLAVIGALIGLGAIVYFTLDKTEKLIESPTVNLVLVAGVAVVFFVLYKQIKGA